MTTNNEFYDAKLGIYRPGGEPERYRWALKRLTEEFPDADIRIGLPTDFGRTWEVGIMLPDGTGRAFPLTKVYKFDPVYDDDGDRITHWGSTKSYDLNDHPEQMDEIVDDLRKFLNGG